MTSDLPADLKAVPDVASLQAQGEQGVRHRIALQETNAALAASPARALLDVVQTIHRILLATDPKALRQSVGWFGRLLGRDIALQAESEAMRTTLGAHVLQARQQLDALAAHDTRLHALGRGMHAAIDELGQQTKLLADQIVAGDASESTQRLQHLATLAASLRITADHLDLTLANHRELIQRVEQMLPRVDLLLDQQRMLHAGMTEQAAFAAANQSLEALQGLEHVNVSNATSADVAADIATPRDATPR